MIVAETNHQSPTEYILYDGFPILFPELFHLLKLTGIDSLEHYLPHVHMQALQNIIKDINQKEKYKGDFIMQHILEGFKPLKDDTQIINIRLEYYTGKLRSSKHTFVCNFGGMSCEIDKPNKVQHAIISKKKKLIYLGLVGGEPVYLDIRSSIHCVLFKQLFYNHFEIE